MTHQGVRVVLILVTVLLVALNFRSADPTGTAKDASEYVAALTQADRCHARTAAIIRAVESGVGVQTAAVPAFVADELNKLDEPRQQGVLSDAEFVLEKSRLPSGPRSRD